MIHFLKSLISGLSGFSFSRDDGNSITITNHVGKMLDILGTGLL